VDSGSSGRSGSQADWASPNFREQFHEHFAHEFAHGATSA